MAEIKPCPFCGRVEFIVLDYIEPSNKPRPYGLYRYVGKVSCVVCGVDVMSSGFHDSVESAYNAAVQRWNRRANT